MRLDCINIYSGIAKIVILTLFFMSFDVKMTIIATWILNGALIIIATIAAWILNGALNILFLHK